MILFVRVIIDHTNFQPIIMKKIVYKINKRQQMKFKKFILKAYPSKDFPQDLSCFQIVNDVPIDENTIAQGWALIKIRWISADPLLRTWISGAKSYLNPVGPGSSIPGFGVAQIVKLNNKNGDIMLQEGDWVIGTLQWSEYAIVDCKIIRRLPIDLGEQNYRYLTNYGPTGLTSYLSIKNEILPFQIINKVTRRLKTKQEINIVITSAAGGVGLTVSQYLSKLGYKNIYGIAGSDQKCKACKQMGCKDAINYKKYMNDGRIEANKFQSAIKAAVGGEIDILYENVGEQMLSSLLNLMADHSKVILCGATATYNAWGKFAGVVNMEKIIFKRIIMQGILYFAESSKTMNQAFMEMIELNIKDIEVIVKGIEALPTVYRDMIDGKFIGKPVVELFSQP